jgi:membrane associated rhomboid family serine protease
VNSGVAYWALVGGFAVGVVVGLLFVGVRRRDAFPPMPPYPTF